MDASLVGAGLGSFRGLEAHLPRPASKNQPETPAWGDAGPAIGDRGGFGNYYRFSLGASNCQDKTEVAAMGHKEA